MDFDDYVAITNLVYRYAELIDRGDLDGVADLFAEGSVDTGDGNILRGRDAVRDMYGVVIPMERHGRATSRPTSSSPSTMPLAPGPAARMSRSSNRRTTSRSSPCTRTDTKTASFEPMARGASNID